VKDFLSHIDAITLFADELIQAAGKATENEALSNETRVLENLTVGHLRRLKNMLLAYHERYGKAEPHVVFKSLQQSDDDQ